MLTSDLPRTVDEAELAGWEGLEVACAACRCTYIVPWHRIRRRTGHRKLLEIKQRLVCEKCRIPPERVSLTRTTYPVASGSPKMDRLEI